MKHLLLLLFLAVLGYALWAATNEKTRQSYLQIAMHHGLRLGGLVLVVLLLLFAAINLPSSVIF